MYPILTPTSVQGKSAKLYWANRSGGGPVNTTYNRLYYGAPPYSVYLYSAVSTATPSTPPSQFTMILNEYLSNGLYHSVGYYINVAGGDVTFTGTGNASSTLYAIDELHGTGTPVTYAGVGSISTGSGTALVVSGVSGTREGSTICASFFVNSLAAGTPNIGTRMSSITSSQAVATSFSISSGGTSPDLNVTWSSGGTSLGIQFEFDIL